MCTDIDEEPIRRAEVNLIVESYGGPGLYGSSAGGYETVFSLSRQPVAIISGLIWPAYCVPTPAASESLPAR